MVKKSQEFSIQVSLESVAEGVFGRRYLKKVEDSRASMSFNLILKISFVCLVCFTS